MRRKKEKMIGRENNLFYLIGFSLTLLEIQLRNIKLAILIYFLSSKKNQEGILSEYILQYLLKKVQLVRLKQILYISEMPRGLRENNKPIMHQFLLLEEKLKNLKIPSKLFFSDISFHQILYN